MSNNYHQAEASCQSQVPGCWLSKSPAGNDDVRGSGMLRAVEEWSYHRIELYATEGGPLHRSAEQDQRRPQSWAREKSNMGS